MSSFSLEQFRKTLLSHDDTVLKTYLEETGFSLLTEVPQQVCKDFFYLLKTSETVDLADVSEERIIEVLRYLNDLEAVYTPAHRKNMFRDMLGATPCLRKRRVL